MAYQPYDGGPPVELLPPPDSGCAIYDPIFQNNSCVQCRDDADCPGPLVCDNSGKYFTPLCVACDAAHPACPAGQVCELRGDICVPDCRLDAGICAGTIFGGHCDFDGGICKQGCLDHGGCAAPNPVCLGPPNYIPAGCGQCSLLYGRDLPNFGCPDGTLCEDVGSSLGGVCLKDCRPDPLSCRPGLCDLDGGSAEPFACHAGLCYSDDDCQGGSRPFCDLSGSTPGKCTACRDDADCAALGLSEPICANIAGTNSCISDCRAADGGLLGCGLQQCAFLDAGTPSGFNIGRFRCSCGSDSDCQPNSPTCIPDSDAGLDPDAGRWGVCGCTPGACAAGTVCETRSEVTLLRDSQSAPRGLCVPDCTSGALDCARVTTGPQVCNPATGYCVPCLDASQCRMPTPACVPSGGPRGGGACGCAAIADCQDGTTCQDPGLATSRCVDACVRTETGFDSCLYGAIGTLYTGVCNTGTGLCQQCLSDSECGGRDEQTPLLADVAAPFCIGGRCRACNTAADCPAVAPGCLDHDCGACATPADCPASAPECVLAPSLLNGPSGLCVPLCTAGGGECAGSPTPVCDAAAGHCVQCLSESDCHSSFLPYCRSGYCSENP